MAKIQISERGKLIGRDIQKVLTGAALAGVGAFGTYFFENITSVDFGDWSPFVAAGVAVFANLFRKWFTENRYK